MPPKLKLLSEPHSAQGNVFAVESEKRQRFFFVLLITLPRHVDLSVNKKYVDLLGHFLQNSKGLFFVTTGTVDR